MKTRSDVYEIIILSRHGMTIREIATELEMSPTTVIKYKKAYEENQQKLQACPQGAELHQITQMLTEEPKYNSSGRKARRWTEELDQMFRQILVEEQHKDELLGKGHKLGITAKRMHEKLVTCGYDISYSTVCKKLQDYRSEHTETFIK